MLAMSASGRGLHQGSASIRQFASNGVNAVWPNKIWRPGPACIPATKARFELGRANVGLSVLFDVAKGFSLSPDKLVSWG